MGGRVAAKIVAELTARPIFLLILSPAAMASGYVQTEFDLAFKQKHSPVGKKIIPILYQPSEPRADMTLFQMISFLAPQSYEQAFAELTMALGVSGGTVQSPPAPSVIALAPSAHVAPPDRFPPRLRVGLSRGLSQRRRGDGAADLRRARWPVSHGE